MLTYSLEHFKIQNRPEEPEELQPFHSPVHPGTPREYSVHLPVLDLDLRLEFIQQLFPQSLSLQVHELLQRKPAGRRAQRHRLKHGSDSSLEPLPELGQLTDHGSRRDATTVVGEHLCLGGPAAEVLCDEGRRVKQALSTIRMSLSYRWAGSVEVQNLAPQVNQVQGEECLCSNLKKTEVYTDQTS